MTEIVIFLEDIDPVVFLGTNNSLLDKIQSFFPKIKILSRGSEIKCIGEESEITLFAEKFNDLIEYYRKYNRLEEQDIEKYFFDAERINGRIRANHFRERVRTLGPSVRPDLGKQANGTAGGFPVFKD